MPSLLGIKCIHYAIRNQKLTFLSPVAVTLTLSLTSTLLPETERPGPTRPPLEHRYRVSRAPATRPALVTSPPRGASPVKSDTLVRLLVARWQARRRAEDTVPDSISAMRCSITAVGKMPLVRSIGHWSIVSPFQDHDINVSHRARKTIR